jgi:glycosyltransferase involved in cell wall biosynthesis
MHILFLSDNFPPEVNAPASRTFEHCREWVRAGHKVTVITCAPNFPGGKVFSGYRNRLWQSESMDGIRVIRVWSYITANEGTLKRILDYVSYMVSATLAALFVRRIDIVVATSPQFFTACAGYAVTRIRRRPFVFELRDLWPESIRAVGALRNERILRFLEWLELFLYRKANAIVSVTHAFRANLAARGIAEEKIFVVTNGADLSRFAPQPKDEKLVRELGLQDKFVAGYIGTHGMAHALETLLQSAALLAGHGDPGIVFLFLGDGAEKKSLEEKAARMKLANAIFIGTVPKEQVSRYWSLLDVSVIHLKKTDLFTTVIPSKLFECTAMGIPVLHGVAGESADIVRQENMGLVFEPENAQMLSQALVRLASDVDLRARLSANGVKGAARYDRSGLALRMLNVLENLVNKGSPAA